MLQIREEEAYRVAFFLVGSGLYLGFSEPML